MLPRPSALTEYADRLLAGTGLTAVTAHAVASGRTPVSAPAARALRDGWTATDLAALPATLPLADETGEPT